VQFAKPEMRLESHLKKAGVQWSSVLNLKDWTKYWELNENPPDLDPDLKFLEQWLNSGAHAQMHYLAKNSQARKDPRLILERVSSIISLIIPYATGHSVRNQPAQRAEDEKINSGILQKTARYARVPDYHRSIKKALDQVMTQWQREVMESNTHPQDLSWRVVTDSLPFLDRAHARIAGLGFVGKNTMLIRPGVGSFFFIAHILVSAPFDVVADANLTKPLAAEAIQSLTCGDCRLCLDACPTSALLENRFLDSNRCLSYLTIENREIISDEFVTHLQNQFYGCDICQDVCPYNLKTTDLQTIAQLRSPRKILNEVSLHDVAGMSPSQYETWFGGSAMTRAKYGGLVRNALYALHALNDQEIERLLETRSTDSDLLIRSTVAHIRKIRTHPIGNDPK
jgi:epoxyqueuosine reductase